MTLAGRESVTVKLLLEYLSLGRWRGAGGRGCGSEKGCPCICCFSSTYYSKLSAYQRDMFCHPSVSVCQNFISFSYWVILHCADRPHYVYSLISWWIIRLFPPWGFMNNLAVKTYKWNRWVIRSLCFLILEELLGLFCSILHSCQQCKRVLTPLHSLQHLSLSVCLLLAIWVGLNWYPIAVFIGISPTN